MSHPSLCILSLMINVVLRKAAISTLNVCSLIYKNTASDFLLLPVHSSGSHVGMLLRQSVYCLTYQLWVILVKGKVSWLDHISNILFSLIVPDMYFLEK